MQTQAVDSRGTDRLVRQPVCPGAEQSAWTAKFRQPGESSLGEWGAKLCSNTAEGRRYYVGQKVEARILCDGANTGHVTVCRAVQSHSKTADGLVAKPV